MTDAELATLEVRLQKLHAQIDAKQVTLESDYQEIDELQDEIAKTPANSMVGVAVKLQVCLEFSKRDLHHEEPIWLPILLSALTDIHRQ